MEQGHGACSISYGCSPHSSPWNNYQSKRGDVPPRRNTSSIKLKNASSSHFPGWNRSPPPNFPGIKLCTSLKKMVDNRRKCFFSRRIFFLLFFQFFPWIFSFFHFYLGHHLDEACGGHAHAQEADRQPLGTYWLSKSNLTNLNGRGWTGGGGGWANGPKGRRRSRRKSD